MDSVYDPLTMVAPDDVDRLREWLEWARPGAELELPNRSVSGGGLLLSMDAEGDGLVVCPTPL